MKGHIRETAYSRRRFALGLGWKKRLCDVSCLTDLPDWVVPARQNAAKAPET